MFSNITKLSLASLIVISASASATTTATFNSNSNVSISSAGNQITTWSNGVNITLTGWSDIAARNDNKTTTVNRFSEDNGGWALINQNEKDLTFSGYCLRNHSSDNIINSCGDKDFDIFLLEFSEEVNLTGADWTDSDSTQVTATTSLSNNLLNDSKWADVTTNQTISSGWTDANTSTGRDFITSTTNVSGTFPKSWLIGALNSVFDGTASNDSIKSINTDVAVAESTIQPATTVPKNASIAMLGLALVIFAVRRKMK